MMRDEIQEYPYRGTITRIIEGLGDEDDTKRVIYTGVMDEHMVSDIDGRTLQTSSYIISIPMGNPTSVVMPHKGDLIDLERYGEHIEFVVDNVEPSQLGGISIYATQNKW
jgi:hypothetical protein